MNRTIKKIKSFVRSASAPFLLPLTLERNKQHIRHRIDNQLLTVDYPFEPEVKLVRHLINNGPAFDIGANHGLYSTALEDKIGGHQLYCFEPLPELHRNLTQRFRKANVYQLALSDQVGEQMINIPYVEGKRYASRASLNNHQEHNQDGTDAISIPTSTVDSTVKELQLSSLGFIKIDVEGHELAVLRGAQETLKTYQPLVLIEIEARHHNFPITDIFSLFTDLGFVGYYLDSHTLTLAPVEQFDVDRDQDITQLKERQFFWYINNFFFVPTTEEDDFVKRTTEFLKAEQSRVVEMAKSQ
jgi:FkbM family methyltransferase